MKQKLRTTNILVIAFLLFMALLLLTMPQLTGVSLAWPDAGKMPLPGASSATSSQAGSLSAQFLTLPFPYSPDMRVQVGWHGGSDGGGIDYIHGKLDDSNTWQSFDVLASAHGEACGNCSSRYGNAVWIKHEGGNTYYTYYGHLNEIASDIPLGSKSNTVHVSRGQKIGVAGDTGTAEGLIHLHFMLKDSSDIARDPYDLYTSREYYYPEGSQYEGLGPNHYWTTDPPSYNDGPTPPPCPPEDCTPGRDMGRDFFVEVLERLADVPVSDFAVDALVAWEPYEDTSACWNPLATTWKMNVVCYFNCLRRDEAGNCILGVQHYQNQNMGVQATANTLNQGYYDAIRRMLRSETFDREGLRAALRTWGTCSGQSCDSLLKNWEDLWNEHSGNDSTVISSDSFRVLQPGQTGEITFDVQNTGRVTWTPHGDYAMINTNGVSLGASPIQTLISEVPPGGVARWVIPITAPSQAGVNWTKWQMAYNEEPFGAMMAGLIIVVPEGEIDFDLLALLEEWVNELKEQVSAELKEFWEDLERRFTEWLQRELERLWREFWESLCGTIVMVLAVLLFGAWGIQITWKDKAP